MENMDTIIKMLQNTYLTNLEILNNQNKDLLINNSDFTKLYQCFWISNERLKNILDTLELLNEP